MMPPWLLLLLGYYHDYDYDYFDDDNYDDDDYDIPCTQSLGTPQFKNLAFEENWKEKEKEEEV